MRGAFLCALFIVSMAIVVSSRDPFGWVFDFGLGGAWGSVLAAWSLGIRRLVRASGTWKRAIGYLFGAITLAAFAVTAVAWGDYHRIAFRRADTEAWAADLKDLRDAIKTLPPGLAARAHTTVESELIRMEQELPSLSEDQRHARLARAIAALRDGHSAAFPFLPATDFSLVPLQLRWFEDGLFVVAAGSRYRELVGQEVVRIAGLDVAQAFVAVRPYVSADNDSAARTRSVYYMLSPRIWRAVGQTVDPDRLDIELRTTQNRRTVQLEPVSRWRYLWWIVEPRAWMWPPKPAPHAAPSFEWRRDPWWITVMPDQHAVYVAFRAVRHNGKETLTDFGRRLIDTARAAKAQRIVIDVRENSGGDNTLFRGFVKALRESEFNTRGRLMLLIGGGTFSAATNFVSTMERETAVTLVGEPTGSGPNHFGDAQPRTLARTGVVVFLSTRYHQFGAADDARTSHDPQIAVGTASADYFAGRDPVLAAALRQL